MQGEGPSVGESTLFVRFAGCDLRCSWCDSPHTWRASSHCRIERARGTATFREVANPLPVEDIVEATRELGATEHRWVSLTGGEPLLQPRAAAALAASLARAGAAIHLETHGLASTALSGVLPHLRAIAMDWKLPSEVRRAKDSASAPGFAAQHERFLERARGVPELVVKLVITPRSAQEEIDRAVESVARLAPGATLVFQPVTPAGSVRERPDAARMLALGRRAERRLADVRVIPQTHPIYGAL